MAAVDSKRCAGCLEPGVLVRQATRACSVHVLPFEAPVGFFIRAQVVVLTFVCDMMLIVTAMTKP